VADPPPVGDPVADREVMVAMYMLGWLRRPVPPPLFYQQVPLADDRAGRLTLRQAAGLVRFSEKTGAMEADLDDLVRLRGQVDRAVGGRG
jgi:hypothetical protein